jgi:hypothetical protein
MKTEEAIQEWNRVVQQEQDKCGSRLIAIARCRAKYPELQAAAIKSHDNVMAFNTRQLELFSEDDHAQAN